MKIKEKLDLLGIKEITTRRQMKNGTIILELPILKYGSKIQVGSFESGYVRRMNGGYTPYQLNKCEPTEEFYKEYKWCDTRDERCFTGKYKKHIGKKRILIPHEADRIDHLITYCLKNYYINQANEVENGKFIPKWRHEFELKRSSKYEFRGGDVVDNETGSVYVHEQHAYWNKIPNSVQVIVDGHRYKIK